MLWSLVKSSPQILQEMLGDRFGEFVCNFHKIILTCAKISVLALSTCFTLAASFRNLAMARGDWVTSPCVLYFSYKDVEDFNASTLPLLNEVLTFESVDEILKCDHSNESYWAGLSCGIVYYALQSGCNFWVCGWDRKVWLHSNESYCKLMYLISSYL